MGTGSHWADKANPLETTKNPKYELLYDMPAYGRYECFPRGIDQIKPKMEKFGPDGKGLAIELEKSLLFTYPVHSILFICRKESRPEKPHHGPIS